MGMDPVHPAHIGIEEELAYQKFKLMYEEDKLRG